MNKKEAKPIDPKIHWALFHKHKKLKDEYDDLQLRCDDLELIIEKHNIPLEYFQCSLCNKKYVKGGKWLETHILTHQEDIMKWKSLKNN